MDPPQHPRIAALGGGERTPPCRTCAAAERRRARGHRRSADPVHCGRFVRRSLGAPAADRRLPDDAVGDLRLLGSRDFHPDLCRLGRRQGRPPPTRMRGTAVAFCFNAPRFISCLGPLIAGTLITSLGGFGPAATIIGLFFIIGVVAAPFLPETKGKPLPHALWLETPTPSAGPAS